ncbi:MAG: OB-fold nucleic acid binding domain-containing protein, partial [Dictyoglomus sp.]
LFATLEDFTGEADITVFSSVYNSYKELLKEGKKVILSGKVEVDREENEERVKILVDQVGDLEGVALTIQFNNEISYELLFKIREVLKRKRGIIPVIIKLDSKLIITSPEFWVTLDNELKKELDSLKKFEVFYQIENILSIL